MLNSRTLAPAAFGLAALLAVAPAAADNAKRHHALSLVGTPKYAADFKHFDWVDPDAPKGGTVRQAAIGTFDTLNPFNIKGNKATGLGLVYESLMATSPDEASAEYCLVCEWVSYPADYGSVTFGLREAARFHDGKPITPDDVIFSLNELKKHDPFQAQYYKNVVKAEKTGDREVTFTFDVKGNRELPQILGQLTVLPMHFWTAKDANGEPRDLGKTTLEPPLGSGPYRIKNYETGRFIEYERVKTAWANDLPVRRGQWNFDTLRFEYFRDPTPAFEAFKSGSLDFWRETSSKQWATAFGFDAVKNGIVKKDMLPLQGASQMQAFVMNERRPQFQDRRVRQAFLLAYDFEFANKNLFFGQYARVKNYFGEKDLASSGLPQGRELEILNELPPELKAGLPPELFTTPYTIPSNDTPDAFRKNMRQAAKLLGEAGYAPKNGVLTNTTTGQPLAVEFLLVSPQFERVVQPYVNELKRLGIQASLRTVDSAQYQRRIDAFDFDIVVGSFPQSASPGNEQRDFFGSSSAGVQGSRNLIGLKSPVVDKLIDKIIFAKDRDELAAATRALDRVLLWGHHLVPQWFTPYDRVAYWDRYKRPAKLPSRSTAFQQVWSWDATAAAKVDAMRK